MTKTTILWNKFWVKVERRISPYVMRELYVVEPFWSSFFAPPIFSGYPIDYVRRYKSPAPSCHAMMFHVPPHVSQTKMGVAKGKWRWRMRAIQMEATNDNEFGNSAVPVPKTGLGRSGSLGGETAVQSRLSTQTN